jgi:eukaryotic-like serine/threonine-protein kinase
MVTAIRLTVLSGPHKDRRFCFCGATQCQVGRALDCFVQISGTERDKLISRHHCRLDIEPPFMRVGDLGSTNGTFVNGNKVDPIPKETVDNPNGENTGLPVSDGDLLTIGGTTIRVDMLNCPHGENDSEGASVWKPGETTKKDCPLPCCGPPN